MTDTTTITLKVTPYIKKVLRERARAMGCSENEVFLDALRHAIEDPDDLLTVLEILDEEEKKRGKPIPLVEVVEGGFSSD